MNPIPARNLLLLLSSVSLVTATTNFTQCLEIFKTNPNATGGVDFNGRDVSAADAVGLKYETCKQLCGATVEILSWREFVLLFSSWQLPWLALASHLPTGSENHIDNFASVVMSIGSPALAAYSLMTTSFNYRMVYNKANRIAHKKKADVAKALVALQQTALELTTDPRLLASIPVDDKWRHEILERLGKRNAWSLATAFSITWVAIIFTFTLVNSFVPSNDSDSSGSDGLAVGTLWLWLLCLVVGWLWVPIFSSEEVDAALRRANGGVVRTAAKKIKRSTARALNRRAREVASWFQSKGQKHDPKTFENPDAGPTPTGIFVDENDELKQGPTDEGETHAGDVPELGSTPSDPSLQAPAESQQDHTHLSIGGIQTAQHSTTSIAHPTETQPSAAASVASLKCEYDRLFLPKVEAGLLHSDEFRHPATFNYSRIIWYLEFTNEVLRALDRPVIADEKRRPFSQVTAPPPAKHSTFPPGALCTMFKSAIFALLLQVGVTSAAVVTTVFAPTFGLGCRSLGYIIYGGIAIIILFLTIISTILARISETRKGKSPFVGNVTAFFAIALRWTCYLLALINSAGLIALSGFQLSNFLNNCYCNAGVIGNGKDTYIIIVLHGWIPAMRKYYAAGVATATSSMFIFMVALWRNSSPSTEMRDI